MATRTPKGASWCSPTVSGGLLSSLLCAALPLSGFAGTDPDEDPAACVALQALDLSEIAGELVTIGSVEVAPGDSGPAFCRISGTLQTQTRFELLLPVSVWNRRLLVCGKPCSGQDQPVQPDLLARGYATAVVGAGTDELPRDVPDDAVHLATLAAREIILSYYGSGPEYAYFSGCAAGGRQGIEFAERHPEDFDGLVVGIPVIRDGSAAARRPSQGLQAYESAGGRLLIHHAGPDCDTAADAALLDALEAWVEQDRPPAPEAGPGLVPATATRPPAFSGNTYSLD